MKTMDKVLELIRTTDMFPEAAHVIAGVSGGADSMYLLHVLLELRSIQKLDIDVIHVHHGIRGSEADRDAAYVNAFCEEHQVPCEIVRRNIPAEAERNGMTLEEAGRAARREIFEEYARKLSLKTKTGEPGETAPCVRIALAHHRDDLAETVLFRLARGTGIDGLNAMEPLCGIYARPLLGIGKDEIIRELRKNGIDWVEDSTNGEDDAARNRIRNQILPLLCREVNSGAARHLAEIAGEAADASAFLQKEAEKRYEKYVSFEEGRAAVSEGILMEMRAMEHRIIKMALIKLSGSEKDLTRGHVEDVSALFRKESGKVLSLPYDLRAKRERGSVIISKNTLKSAEMLKKIEMRKLPYEGAPIPEKRYTKWVDYDKINSGITVRKRMNGDYLVIDEKGHKKSLSDYFTDQHVPVQERDSVTLIADGQEIVWVVGMRIGYRYRITERTNMILELRVKEEDDV